MPTSDPLYDPKTGATDGDDVRHHCGSMTLQAGTPRDDSEPVIDYSWWYEDDEDLDDVVDEDAGDELFPFVGKRKYPRSHGKRPYKFPPLPENPKI